MVRIIWKNCPDASKNGVIDFASPAAAEVLVTTGQADYKPYTDYRDRLAAEGAPAKLHASSVAVAFVHPARWELRQLPRTGTPVIMLLKGTEEIRFTDEKIAAKHGCPASLCKQFTELVNAKDTNNFEATKDRILREQAEQKQRESILTRVLLSRSN